MGHEDTLEVCITADRGQVDASEQLSFHLRQLYGLATHSGNPNWAVICKQWSHAESYNHFEQKRGTCLPKSYTYFPFVLLSPKMKQWPRVCVCVCVCVGGGGVIKKMLLCTFFNPINELEVL